MLALKDNHPTLAAQVQAAFEDHLESSTAEQGPGYYHQIESGTWTHGRTRRIRHPRAADIAWPCQLAGSGVVGDDDYPSDRGHCRNRLRPLLPEHPAGSQARRHAKVIRDHWGIGKTSTLGSGCDLSRRQLPDLQRSRPRKPRSLESTRALTDQATSKHRQYSWQTKNVRLGRRDGGGQKGYQFGGQK